MKDYTPRPEVFTVAPPLPGDRKPGMLTDAQVQQYFREGYVLVENCIPTEYLEACKSDIETEVDELAQKLYAAGKIPSLYEEYGFFQRLTKINEAYPGAHVVLHKIKYAPKAVRDLWSSDKLLDIAEQILGTTEIQGHPVWNLRTKTPNTQTADVPWHQDSAYLDSSSYDVHQLTAWVPLLDATEQNGCMQMVRRGHTTGKMCTHTCCYGGTWYVMLDDVTVKETLGVDVQENTVTCEVPFGGVLFFNNLIPHRSLPNLSTDIRWSLDLRWQRQDLPVGFHGLKEGVALRSARPGFAVDWGSFDGLDRHEAAKERNREWNRDKEQPSDEFDTTISGPWMTQWEIVHTNQHTDTLAKQ